jgi:hypothetical protein
MDFTITVGDTFVAVTGITGVSSGVTVGTTLTLTGTVAPDTATNKTIDWTVKTAGTTAAGAAITDGNKLNATGTGTVEVTATIANGTAEGTAFTKDFTITVSPDGAYKAVTGITGVPGITQKTVDLALTGTVEPSNATNNTIVWTVTAAGSTGATIENGSTLKTSADGNVAIRATIVNGASETTDYTADFTIGVTNAVVNCAVAMNMVNGVREDTVTGTLTNSDIDALYFTNYTADPAKPLRIDMGGAAFTGTFPSYTGGESLISIILPPAMTDINSMAFTAALNLESITITGSALFGTEGGVLYGLTTGDKTKIVRYPPAKAGDSFTLPATVIDASSGAFEDTKHLKTLNGFEQVVPTDGRTCFFYSSVENLTLSASLINLHAYIFYGSNLRNITIPASVLSFSGDNFRDCGQLEWVVMEPPTVTTYNGHTHAFYDANPSLIIYVPDASVTAYKADSGWSGVADKIKGISEKP